MFDDEAEVRRERAAKRAMEEAERLKGASVLLPPWSCTASPDACIALVALMVIKGIAASRSSAPQSPLALVRVTLALVPTVRPSRMSWYTRSAVLPCIRATTSCQCC